MALTHENGVIIRYSPLGHFQITVSAAAVGLPSLPNLDRLRRIVIRNLDQPICWRDDGVDPTSGSGMKAMADEIVVYDGNFPDQFRMIRAGSSDADVRIAYYGT